MFLRTARCLTPPFATLLVAGSLQGFQAPDSNSRLEILDPFLATRIQLLEERSPQLRAAMDAARAGPIPVVIGTPVQVQERLGGQLNLAKEIGNERIGEFRARRPDPELPEIDLVVIRVDLTALHRAAKRRLIGGTAWLERTTDAIVIHELWGHAVPVLAAGSITGRCPDPRPGEVEAESCVMRRESVLRAELGLSPRKTYSISR